MNLPQTWLWSRRISSLLLMAMLVVPEVRCCCNQSWGPAGLQGMAPETQDESPSQKCCCCARLPGNELDENPVSGVQAQSRPRCECQLLIVSQPLPQRSQDFEHCSAWLPSIHLSPSSKQFAICLSAAGVDSPHLPSRSALEHCAYFQTWRS